MDAWHLVRTARLRAALTLRQLAARSGTSHATLSAYEQGTKVPTVETLDRVLTSAGFAADVGLERRIRGDRLGERGDELVAVLELAEAFPARHARRLHAPVFPAPVPPRAPTGPRRRAA